MIGAITIVVGSIGVLRFPDFFTRVHAAGVTETAGAIFIFFGLMLEAGIDPVALKLIMIFFFLFVTGPTSSHALAKAAIHGGLSPVPKD